VGAAPVNDLVGQNLVGVNGTSILVKTMSEQFSSSQKYKENHTMLRTLLNDEAGFIVSAELVLIATILVIGLIVGLSQVQHAVVEELNDVAHAIGSLNQGFSYTGFSAEKGYGRHSSTKSETFGSAFASSSRGRLGHDGQDTCDANCGDIACDAPARECDGQGRY